MSGPLAGWSGRGVGRPPRRPTVRVTVKALLLMAGSCTPAGNDGARLVTPVDSSARLKVFVSIPPQAYFVERVGGERVDVDVLVRPGQSPATYEPTPKQMAALADAEVYFRIGVPFETPLIGKIAATFANLRIVDTREGITLRRMEVHGHDGGPDHSHHDGAPDPHLWLDPRLVKVQAQTICRALSKLDPARAGEFQRNLQAFQAELDEVHARLTTVLAPLKGRELFVFHPAYGYFADAYGLKQVAVESGGKEPGQRSLVALIEEARRKGVRLIFVQPQFAVTAAEMIAEAIGGAVVPLDPLARDYLENLGEMASKIERGLTGQEPGTDSRHSSPLKKGTGSEPNRPGADETTAPRGACTLFQRTHPGQEGAGGPGQGGERD